MRTPNQDMVIDTVDRADGPLGTIRRKEVLSTGDAFRVSHVFLLNANKELLIQQIHPSRQRHPSHWGSSVAAYLFAGETYEEAAIRRLAQELGILNAQISFHEKTSMQDGKSLKFISLFTLSYDGPITPDSGHIAQTNTAGNDLLRRPAGTNEIHGLRYLSGKC